MTAASKPCGCGFDRAPVCHDLLLTFETMSPVEAADLIACLIGDDDTCTDAEALFRDPDEFEHFVSSHNWSDPAAMTRLGNRVTHASNQAHRGSRFPERWHRDPADRVCARLDQRRRYDGRHGRKRRRRWPCTG